MPHQELSRRSFLTRVGTIAAATGFGGSLLTPKSVMSAFEQTSSHHPICIFVKFLQTLSFDELADTIASMEVAGIEATVRKGGQILPEHVEEQLPKLVEALRRRNLDVTIMTSNVSSVDQPLTEKVLRTAAGLGIKRYRMDYYRYDLKKPILPQLLELQPVIKDLAALNREIGIQGVYQNHAGPTFVGAGIWDMARLLEGIPKEEIALAYDIRHATVEGGTTWQTTWNLAQPHLGSVFVKDTRWQGRKLQDGALGLPDGVVDPKFFTMLKQSDPSNPISLHVEYLTKDPPDVQIAAIRENLATLRELLARA
ncbi:MAG TPA: TIM barrel protein [Planctomicrobium sp.]|nr:TIM barrel protein [Planctomicrobium sp.]